ncbi:AAA family ATPase [Devosia nitrariae]|uniref:non-specific protein-tyrosine kinase n=1 Tax=Devosia nitrariae TaxID=2071872 RepID=A0ABQ5WCY9_9HYPH|nr:AAA family ATPase [Devosia nitrariae]GLQ57969.1 chain-length determining protein [Devosia nitrariae]
MLERSNFPEMSGPRNSDVSFIDIDRILSILRRQYLVLTLGLALGLGLGLLYLLMAPRTYVSASQILIDKNLQEMASEVAAPTSALDLEAEILNQIEVLKSSRIASAVAGAENLMTDEEFLNPPPSFTQRIRGTLLGLLSPLLGPAEAEPRALEATVQETAGALRAGVVVERVGRSAVIRVAYEAPSPELAHRIANAYAEAFVQDQLNADLEATRQATDWLQGRLAELGESQRQATLAVQLFRRESGLTRGEDEELSNQRLEALTDQLVLAQAETARVRALSNQVQAVINAGPEAAADNVALLSNTGIADEEISAIRTRYASVTRRIDEITASFGADHPQIAVLEAERRALTDQIFVQLRGLNEQYRNQLTIAERQENGLRESIETEGRAAAQANQAQVELNALQQRSAALGILYNSFLSRYEESIQRQSFPIPGARIITEPELPRAPSGPRTLFVLAGSLIFGMFLGLGAGAVNELRERSFRIGSQISNELGLRFLGYLPKLNKSGLKHGKAGTAVQNHRYIRDQVIGRRSNAPTTAFLETLKSAKLMLRKRHHAGRSVTVGVVSVLPGEGKTTFAVSFAEMLAANGDKVLLIDADLRQPAASRLTAPGATLGLMDMSAGRSWREIARIDEETGLTVIPATSSQTGSTSNDFLTSQPVQSLLEEARREFDYVVIDLPPLGPMVDALSIEPWTDGFILVTEWGRTPRRLVRAILENEPQLSDEIIGVVLNKVDFARLSRYSDPGAAERYVGTYSRYYNVTAPDPNKQTVG